MSVVVAVIIAAGMASMCVGIVTSLITAMLPVNGRHRPRKSRRPAAISTGAIYWSFTVWTVVLGIFLMLAPPCWFGPSWSYFKLLPHNGTGMGICLIILSVLQVVALWRDFDARILSILFFLNGFVYWTAGIILGAEGLLGHQGLMEAPFMLCIGAQAFALSASLRVNSR
jgi:magnesium-transporting ATPase (P-type)